MKRTLATLQLNAAPMLAYFLFKFLWYSAALQKQTPSANFVTMVLQSSSVHPRGLSLKTKGQVYVKGKHDQKTFKEIASEV